MTISDRIDGIGRAARRVSSAGALLLVLLTVSACRTAPPSAVVESPLGIVRADTPSHAREVSRLKDRLVPGLQAIRPGLLHRKVEVWIQDRIELVRGSPYPDHIAGMAEYERGRVYLRRNDPELELHLAHELVHVLLDDAWRILPGVLEEGVCDLAASLLVEPGGVEHQAKRLIEASAFFGGFDVVVEVKLPEPARRIVVHRMRLSFDKVSDMSVAEILDLGDEQVFDHATSDEGVGLYGLGFVVVLAIVDRIGFDGLRGVCLRSFREGESQVPRDRLLEAAGLTTRRSEFRRTIEKYLGPAELPLLADLLADGLAKATVEAARARHPFRSADEFLVRGDPHVGLPGRAARLRLRDVDAFRAAVRHHWSR
ncbi:MAG: hypothetical protein ACF8XB_08250 [Planctomycetota bacterium JB042]